ncbi:MAG TPA: PEP/pyruvate-binding domain-containing protein, partial [Syntrophorhabdaceae bacterium]|nr:PEP/pyruvate-binding domain-containing protein [Syntrophorhabdaceae bacterium]
MTNRAKYIRWFETLGSKDVHLVGGKNASLGEMIHSLKKEGIRVPDGFATTSDAYWSLLDAAHLVEKVEELLDEFERDERSLEKVGRAIRGLFQRSFI